MRKTFALAGSTLVALAAVQSLAMPAVIRTVHNETPLAQQALTELKAAVTLTMDELRATLSASMDKQGAELVAATAQLDKLAAFHEALTVRMATVEQFIERANANGGGTSKPKTVGEQVAEDEKFKAFMAQRSQSSVRMAIMSPAVTPELIQPDREREIVRPERERLTIRQLLSVGRTTSNAVEYVRQTGFTNAAKFVSEGAAKPYSDLAYDMKSTPIRTLAHLFKVSRQAWDDAEVLRSDIDNEGRYGLDVVEEKALLSGDGAGQNLHGLQPQADVFDRAVSGDTKLDKILRAKTQVRLNFYEPTGMIMHPVDYEEIMLTKDANGNYQFGSPLNSSEPNPWGMPTVITTAIDEGEFLMGDFKRAATIYDRMGTEVLVSSENSDDFEKNMLTVRIEKRLGLAVKRPAALVGGSF